MFWGENIIFFLYYHSLCNFISSCIISRNLEAAISTKSSYCFQRGFPQHVQCQIIFQADPSQRAQKELSNSILHSQNWLLDWNLCLSEVKIPISSYTPYFPFFPLNFMFKVLYFPYKIPFSSLRLQNRIIKLFKTQMRF